MQYTQFINQNVLFVYKKNWEHQVVVSLNKWLDSIPDSAFTMDPDRADLAHFRQSARPSCCHITVFKCSATITSPCKDVGFPSLAISTNVERCTLVFSLRGAAKSEEQWLFPSCIQRRPSHWPRELSSRSSNFAGIDLFVNISRPKYQLTLN
ncbi:hypothetical protein EV421DRAFT_1425692 [Armillaria borealis]|uniref:Uncharacterized protein n=1 Tax=Armillaria borealis TaxID=47425 RepID=A0AA39J0Z4_9AGAR|nr:hypothetical protein EV421DRAFT_1425692 [Armillaria borealis]